LFEEEVRRLAEEEENRRREEEAEQRRKEEEEQRKRLEEAEKEYARQKELEKARCQGFTKLHSGQVQTDSGCRDLKNILIAISPWTTSDPSWEASAW
jgi:hypothetical protein